MTHYWLRLLPEQALHIEDDRVIPAHVIRGAIANILLGTCIPGHEHDVGPCSAECRYWSLFGEGVALKIGAAYAGTADETRPFLATARTCTRSPGFRTAGGHGIFDIAIRQTIFEQACTDPQNLLVPYNTRCPQCNAPLVACEGLFTQQGEREFVGVGDVSASVVVTGVALDRTRKQIVARYRTEGRTINRSIYYVAHLDIPSHLDGLLRQTLADGLWIGGQRSRGMGAVHTELVPYTSPRLTLSDRIAHFNRAVRAEQRFYAAMDTTHFTLDDGEWYFTLDLPNPAYAAYESSLSIVPRLAMLPAAVPLRHWLHPHTAKGWHAAAGVPRRTQIGAAGVVLYRVPAETNRVMVEEVLAFLEAEGIGLGRERGYGAVTICDPFHLIVEPL
ncbi:MAG: hypothetical protein ABI947_11585 [Chloroflexota bacterium]